MNKIFRLNSYIIFFFLILICGCADDEESAPPQSANLELSISALHFSSIGGEELVSLSSTAAWKIVGIPSWLTVSPSSGKAGDHEISFKTVINNLDSENKVRLEVQSGDKKINLPVFQLEKGVLDFTKKEFVLFHDDLNLNVSYRTNIEPQITIPIDASWIKLVSSKVVTDKKVSFLLERNDTKAVRHVEIIISNDANQLKDTLSVTQYPVVNIKYETDTWFSGYKDKEVKIEFSCNIPLTVTPVESKEWIKFKNIEIKNGVTIITFTVNDNLESEIRKGEFTLTNSDCKITRNLIVNQMYKASDGDVVVLHKSDHVNTQIPGLVMDPPDIVFMSDGFTVEEIESGIYDYHARKAYEAFFSVEPYKSFKNYFDSYLIYSASEDSGIDDPLHNITGKKTKFNTRHTERGSGMSCDFDPVIEYVRERLGLEIFNSNTSCIVMLANSKRYGGTCLLSRYGAAIAICPVSEEPYPNNMAQIVRHEAGGHGFGKLADEYWYNSQHISTAETNELKGWQEANFYKNVSLSSTDVSWKEFVGHIKYPEVGIVEGGYYCGRGVWRSTESSLMRDMKGGFNAYGRFLIWSRLKEQWLEILDLTMSGFVDVDKKDDDNVFETRTLRGVPERHTASPIFVD